MAALPKAGECRKGGQLSESPVQVRWVTSQKCQSLAAAACLHSPCSAAAGTAVQRQRPSKAALAGQQCATAHVQPNAEQLSQAWLALLLLLLQCLVKQETCVLRLERTRLERTWSRERSSCMSAERTPLRFLLLHAACA